MRILWKLDNIQDNMSRKILFHPSKQQDFPRVTTLCNKTFENDRRNRNLCLTWRASSLQNVGYGRQPCARVPYPNDRCHQSLHTAFSIASFHPSLCFVKTRLFFFFLIGTLDCCLRLVSIRAWIDSWRDRGSSMLTRYFRIRGFITIPLFFLIDDYFSIEF